MIAEKKYKTNQKKKLSLAGFELSTFAWEPKALPSELQEGVNYM